MPAGEFGFGTWLCKHAAARKIDRTNLSSDHNGLGEPQVAVCLLPGTELAFDENVKCRPLFDISFLPSKKIGQRLARFRQIDAESTVTHHDALEFPDGQVVPLTRLCEGSAQRYCSCRLPHTPCSRERSRGSEGVPC